MSLTNTIFPRPATMRADQLPYEVRMTVENEEGITITLSVIFFATGIAAAIKTAGDVLGAIGPLDGVFLTHEERMFVDALAKPFRIEIEAWPAKISEPA